jgi:hypothetical protein
LEKRGVGYRQLLFYYYYFFNFNFFGVSVSSWLAGWLADELPCVGVFLDLVPCTEQA